MTFFTNIIGLLAANNVSPPKYGPIQTLYGMEPTIEEAPWFILIKFFPLIVIVSVCSFIIGVFLVLRKKKNDKKNIKKR